jgi:glycosyltransferase involved in cell wall biosynthesis
LLPLPLDAGPKTRSFYVLRYLAEAGHDVSLLCFLRPGDSPERVADLKRICAQVETVSLVRSRVKDVASGVMSLFSATPFLIRRDDVAEMWRKIEAMTSAQSFDAVHADQLWMAPYGLKCPDVPLKVLDQHNAVFLAARRMAQQVRNPVARALVENEAAKLEVYEQTVCREFDKVVWVTDADRRALQNGRAPSSGHELANGHTLSNGHERNGHDRVIPIAIDPREQPAVNRPRPFRVTFLGGMHWPPNAEGVSWFADSVWPKVAQAAPGAVLTIIGKKPPQRLSGLPEGGRIEVAGYVSDLGKYLSETAVFIVPIRSGAGMRVKILDAWCWKLPVVSTTVGAEGTEARADQNILLADDDESFADSVIKVLRDKNLAARLAENGRSTVEESYDWKKVYAAWDQIYS